MPKINIQQVGFYMMALAPIFALASKIDFHSLPAILVGLGAIVASVGSSLTHPPAAASKVV